MGLLFWDLTFCTLRPRRIFQLFPCLVIACFWNFKEEGVPRVQDRLQNATTVDPLGDATPDQGGHDQVCIVMCTYNGGAFLQAQLDSFAAQTHENWQLLISDDGSQDDSPKILAQFADRMRALGRVVQIIDGPRRGATANFIHALTRLPPGVAWVALSDQDDVWLPDRLRLGIATLKQLARPGQPAKTTPPGGRPALFCSRTQIADADLAPTGVSPAFSRPPGFRNALVQNIAAGNTILLDQAAIALVRAAGPIVARAPDLPAHDWWLYQIVSGAGGTVHFDHRPSVIYRQHGGNEIGANTGWRARAWRFRMLCGGRFQRWNRANIRALTDCAAHLTPQNRQILERFALIADAGMFRRLLLFSRLRLYRQTLGGQGAMWFALIIGKF